MDATATCSTVAFTEIAAQYGQIYELCPVALA